MLTTLAVAGYRSLREILVPLGQLTLITGPDSQLWVVSHSPRLTEALRDAPDCASIVLHKELGETVIAGQTLLDRSGWSWPPI